MTKSPTNRPNSQQDREVSAEEAARLRELRNKQYESRREAARQDGERPKASKGKRKPPAEEAGLGIESQTRAGSEGDEAAEVTTERDVPGGPNAKRASRGQRSRSSAQRSRKPRPESPEDQESNGPSRISVVDRYLATPEDKPQGWARALRTEEDLFYADREVFDRAGTSLPWYRKHLGVLMDWLEEQGIASCEVVTEADMQAFLKAAAYRASGQQDDLRDLDIAARIFFNLMVSEEIIAKSPMMRMPRVQPRPGAFPVVEPEVLKQAAKTASGTPHALRDVALVLCFADLSWAPDRLAQLTVADVDFVTGAVLARGHSWSSDIVGLLGREALAALDKHLGRPDAQPLAQQPLWLEDSGEPMTAPHIVRLLRQLGVVAEPKGRPKTGDDFTITVTITISRGRR